MSLALYRPLASLGELSRLEDRLRTSRRRFLRLAKTWGLGVVALTVIGLLAPGDGDDPGARFAPFVLCLATAIPVAVNGVRTFLAHPRLLAAQRELLKERGLDPAPSDRQLHAEIRITTEALRARVSSLAPPRPDLEQALELGEIAVESLCDELARSEVRRARWEIGRAGSGPAESSHASVSEALRNRLESYRLALANVEISALLEPEVLPRDGLSAVLAAAQLAGSETALVAAGAEARPGAPAEPAPEPPTVDETLSG